MKDWFENALAALRTTRGAPEPEPTKTEPDPVLDFEEGEATAPIYLLRDCEEPRFPRPLLNHHIVNDDGTTSDWRSYLDQTRPILFIETDRPAVHVGDGKRWFAVDLLMLASSAAQAIAGPEPEKEADD